MYMISINDCNHYRENVKQKTDSKIEKEMQFFFLLSQKEKKYKCFVIGAFYFPQ